MGLTATNDGERQIDLSWTAPSDDGGADITGYRIEVSEDGAAWSDLADDTGNTDTTHAHTGLNVETTRHYRVSTINSAGIGPASSIATGITAPPTFPNAPSELTATRDEERRIDLSWTAPSDDGGANITGYRIEVSDDDSTWIDVVANTESTATMYTQTELEVATTRHYRVSAINSAGTGPASNVAIGITAPATVPTVSRGLAATKDAVRRIDLKWSAPSDNGGAEISGYRIEVSENGSTWSNLVTNTETIATTHSHTGLRGETTRHYRVFAINSAGTGPASNVATGISAPATVPAAPTELTATAGLERRSDLSWSTPADDGGANITGYRIQVSSDNSTWIDLETDTGSTDTAYPDTELRGGSNRHYRVSAINSAGAGPPSNAATGTTAPPTVPDAPLELRASQDVGRRIDLSWSTPADDGGAYITGYRIEESGDGLNWSDLVTNTETSTTTYTHTGLRGEDTRHYRVSAINSAGTGPASDVATGITAPASVPGEPRELTATMGLERRIDISWSTPDDDGGADVTGYRIETSDDGSSWNDLVSNTGAIETTHTHSGLRGGATHHYRVSVINSAGTGKASNVAVGTTIMATPASDRTALIALYNAADGASWANNKNWLSNAPMGDWFGVTTNLIGRVTELTLSVNWLNGKIPQQLGNLPYLEKLSLGGNQLSGEIPPQLGNLSYLDHLSLGGNQLSGKIPPQLGSLSYLDFLSLSDNLLTGEIPPELGNLSYLELLTLSENKLSGKIPPELGKPTYLWSLSLNENQLSGEIPPELGNLPYLRDLRLNQNQLSGEIPPELGNIQYLEGLHLSQNRLSGQIPPELGNFLFLEYLTLINNQLSGEIPPELDNLSYVVSLRLDENQLTGCVPWELRSVRDIGFVGLPFCLDTDEMPAGTTAESDRAALVALYHATNGPNWKQNRGWLSAAPIGEWFGVTTDQNGRVSGLNLNGNWLSGEIPPELGNLSYLQHLFLSRNQLIGEIPAELGDLSNLVFLTLSANQLSGEIPPELGKPSYLTILYLSQNQLNGNIPPQLGNLSFLRYLVIEENQLTGCIPSGLRQIQDIRFVGLPFCSVQGEMPKNTTATSDRAVLIQLYHATNGPNWKQNSGWLSDAPIGEWFGVTTDHNGRITWLDLTANRLSGEIPRELGNLSFLYSLNLSQNRLGGQIPPELSKLSRLNNLTLSQSQLRGKIPTELANLSRLGSLNLSQNSLSGRIPPQLGNLFRLVTLNVAQNRLSGEIPPQLGNLSNLRYLVLYENRLRGEIPPHLGNLSVLSWLFLNHNRFSGTVPPVLGKLLKMERLNLEANLLTGRIPSGLGNLFKLEWLSLNDNRFSGEIPTQLEDLYNLARLRLGGSNKLSGCIPGSLRDVPHSDLAEVGLQPCEHRDMLQTKTPSTQLSTPPRSLGLDPYYEKYLDVGGIPIATSSIVPDAALFRVRDIINEMLSDRPELHTAMAKLGVHVAIMPQGSAITNLPEFRDNSRYWDTRVEKGGIYAGGSRLVVGGEENILCQETNIYKLLDVFVHEFAHAVDHAESFTGFRAILESAYEDAMDSGLWAGTYASRNPSEYWAQAVGIWFDVGIELELTNRSRLLAYDPALAALIQRVFGDAEISSSCHLPGYGQGPTTGSIQGTVTGPDGQPLEGVLIRAVDVKSNTLGGVEIKYEDVTAADGSFYIGVSDNVYYLLIGNDDCNFVGAYRAVEFTQSIGMRTPVEVDGADVMGIEIKLPAHVRDLPVIRTGSCL